MSSRAACGNLGCLRERPELGSGDRSTGNVLVQGDNLEALVSNISWQRTYSTRNDSKGIVNAVEHILVYSKHEGWQPKKLPRTEEMDKK